jgi:hypothetical protein
MHYVVIETATSTVVYSGDSIAKAAYMLNPGTVYSSGETEHEATVQALERARAAEQPTCEFCRKPRDPLEIARRLEAYKP